MKFTSCKLVLELQVPTITVDMIKNAEYSNSAAIKVNMIGCSSKAQTFNLYPNSHSLTTLTYPPMTI